MAGDWIKMRHSLQRDARVGRIAVTLGADRLRVIGGLHALWSLADEQTEDGTLKHVTFALLDEMIGWQGFCAALEQVDWISATECGVSFPRYDEHNGETAKARCQKNGRQARWRDGSASTDASTEPSTREEKRREEKETPTSGFLRFWDAYPPGPGGRKRVHKDGCIRSWNSNNLEAEAEAIIAHVTMMAKCADWTKENGQYIPMTKTYLNQRRWDVAAPRNPVNQQQQFFNRGPRL